MNLGLNDETVKGLSSNFGDRFALDSYRRFLNMFGTVVMNIPHNAFEHAMDRLKTNVGAKDDGELTTAHLASLVIEYKKVYVDHGKNIYTNIYTYISSLVLNFIIKGHKFPTDPYEQLHAAIAAVFDSWESTRAKKYREAESITGLMGTAVNVQAMCFGNMGDTSGTGVCFTRNPNNGDNQLYGEYLINAQGEDGKFFSSISLIVYIYA